jgi:hypothetical protein
MVRVDAGGEGKSVYVMSGLMESSLEEERERLVSCVSAEYSCAVAFSRGKSRLPVERSQGAGEDDWSGVWVLEKTVGRRMGRCWVEGLRIGVDVYTMTESGVSLRMSTGKGRSWSVGSDTDT